MESMDFVWFHEGLEHPRDYSTMLGSDHQNQVIPARCSSPITEFSTAEDASSDSRYQRDFERLREQTNHEGYKSLSGSTNLSPLVAQLSFFDSDSSKIKAEYLDHSLNYSSTFGSDDQIQTAPERCNSPLGFNVTKDGSVGSLDFSFPSDFVNIQKERLWDQRESKGYNDLAELSAVLSSFVARPSFFSSSDTSDDVSESEGSRKQLNVRFFKAGKLSRSLRVKMPFRPLSFIKLLMSESHM